jgi:hypothetical protein
MLSTVIALLGGGGAIAVVSAVGGGRAPGNGQQVYDAPGCGRPEYDGPSPTGRPLLLRSCPRPTAVIVAHTVADHGAWRVLYDGSRSFDPVGGKIIKYQWLTDSGQLEGGPRIAIRYFKPGLHYVELRLTDDGGTLGTAVQTVSVP